MKNGIVNGKSYGCRGVPRHTAANFNFHIKTVTKEADSKTTPTGSGVAG